MTMSDEIDKFIQSVEDKIDDAIRAAVEDGIVAFEVSAPQWTYLYRGNLIVFPGRSGGTERVDERLRDPKNRGQFSDEAEQAIGDLLVFISDRIPEVFTIDNPTSYAELIEVGQYGRVTGSPPVMKRVADAMRNRLESELKK